MYYTPEGVGLAILSGGIMSGIGYIMWYVALVSFPAVPAAVLQLSVPVIAVLGGVVFCGGYYISSCAFSHNGSCWYIDCGYKQRLFNTGISTFTLIKDMDNE